MVSIALEGAAFASAAPETALNKTALNSALLGNAALEEAAFATTTPEAAPTTHQKAPPVLYPGYSRSELCPSSRRFPAQLKRLASVPERLYVLGQIEAFKRPALAIVGARKATPYGLACARNFAREAASRGIAIVSGGAIGCDMAAHEGALEAGGSTLIVLGSGADVVYPKRAAGLFKQVLDAGGALLSELPWGSPPLPWAFSRRNRLIAALASATLIVEAGLPSGTFQTADHTLALGNEVLVVPGSIFSKESKGSNRLLVQGALPIVDNECFADVLADIFGERQTRLPWLQENGGRGEYEPESLESVLLASIAAEPLHLEDLVAVHRLEVLEVVRALSKMELGGFVERLRDGRYMAKPFI